MKTPSTFLYDLVHNLSKSEKRYIKVQSGSRENDYIQLMDAILQQKQYDEALLIKQYKDSNFIKHLSVNKRYLYDLILKSLSNFGQQSLEDKVYEKISSANTLIEKGLFKAAFNELKKGKKIVEKYELFDLQIMLCGIEKKLLSLQKFKTKDTQIVHQIFNTESNSLEQLKNINAYWYIVNQLAQFQMRYQKIQTDEQQKYIDSIVQSDKFKNISLATNSKSKLLFYQANSIYHFMQGNGQKAYENNKEFLDLLEIYPHFLRIYAERYIATLNNILIDSFVLGKYEVLEAGINRLTKIPQRPEFKNIKNLKPRVFRQKNLLLINWRLKEKEFDKALELIPEIEKGLNEFGKQIEKHHRITFYYLIAYILLINKDYNQSLKWNNVILFENKEDVVKEIFNFSRILNLLNHYSLGNYSLLESLLLSTPKVLKSRRAIYNTEKTLFKFLSKSMNSINKVEKKKLIQDFKNDLDTLSNIPKEKRVFNYLDLRLWEIK